MGIWGAFVNEMKSLIGAFVPKPEEENLPGEFIPPWMKIADSQIGVTEIPGPMHNKTILDYHDETSLDASTDEVPWCSSFVNWVMEKAGIPGTRSAAARSWEKWGVQCDPPVYGSVIVLSRGKNPALGHVGFFVGWSADGRRVHVLGGNQNNMVNISTFPKSRVVAFRWPKEL